MTERWLMLAFPGEDVGRFALRSFAPLTKNPKTWWRLLPTREAALACKRELVKAGIRYKCVKVQDTKSRQAKPFRSGRWQSFPRHRRMPGEGEFGGKLNARQIEGSWRRRKARRK